MNVRHELLTGVAIAGFALAVTLPLLDQVAGATNSRALAAPEGSTAVANAAPFTAQTYRSTAGGWSVEIPDDWNATDEGRSAVFRSYDPAKVGFERDHGPENGGIIPPGHVKVEVNVFPTQKPISAAQAADANIGATSDAGSRERRLVSRRDDLVISGRPATLLVIASTRPGVNQVSRLYFATSSTGDRLFMVRVTPDNTTRSVEVDRVISTLAIQ